MTNDIFARDPDRPSTRPSFTRKAAWGRPPGSGLASHTWRGSLLQAVTLSVHPALLVGHHTEGVGTSAHGPGLAWRWTPKYFYSAPVGPPGAGAIAGVPSLSRSLFFALSLPFVSLLLSRSSLVALTCRLASTVRSHYVWPSRTPLLLCCERIILPRQAHRAVALSWSGLVWYGLSVCLRPGVAPGTYESISLFQDTETTPPSRLLGILGIGAVAGPEKETTPPSGLRGKPAE